MRSAGNDWKSCAESLGVNQKTLRNALHRHGMKTKRGPGWASKITKEAMESCAELRSAGKSWPECGEILGLNWRSMRVKMRLHGIGEKGRQGRERIITDSIMAEAAKLRDAGIGWKGCEKRLGVKRSSLRGALRRSGFEFKGVPPEKATAEVIAQAIKMREEKTPWKVIGRKIGMHWEVIARRVNRERKAS